MGGGEEGREGGGGVAGSREGLEGGSDTKKVIVGAPSRKETLLRVARKEVGRGEEGGRGGQGWQAAERGWKGEVTQKR